MPWRFGSRCSVFVHCSYAHWSSHVAFGVVSISDGFDAVAIFCSAWRELSNGVYIFFTQGHVVCHVSMHGNLECCTIFSRDEGACWRFISHRMHVRTEWGWCPWIIYWMIIPFNHYSSPFVTCACRKTPWNLASRSVSGGNTCVGPTFRHHNSAFRSPLDVLWVNFCILLWFISMISNK